MRGAAGYMVAAVVLVPLLVWWVVVKVRAGTSGVSAHRALLASDRHYRQLVAQADADKRMGDPNGYAQWQADTMLFQHLEDTGKLTSEEARQALAQADARYQQK